VTNGSPHVRTIVDLSPVGARRRAGVIAMACVLVLLLASVAIYFLPGR
jgi:hypothetical protein